MKKWNESRFDYLRNLYDSLKNFLLQFLRSFLKQCTADSKGFNYYGRYFYEKL
jgi:hypothetical protein